MWFKDAESHTRWTVLCCVELLALVFVSEAVLFFCLTLKYCVRSWLVVALMEWVKDRFCALDLVPISLWCLLAWKKKKILFLFSIVLLWLILFCVWRTKVNSNKRFLCNLLAKVHLAYFCTYIYIYTIFGVLLCMSELEVHIFPIAKQLLCLSGLQRLRAIPVITHPSVIRLLCVLH